MTVYHVDYSYEDGDQKRYYVLPYNLKGTLKIHFGLNVVWVPWHGRFTSFFSWAVMTRFKREKAERLANKMNSKC